MGFYCPNTDRKCKLNVQKKPDSPMKIDCDPNGIRTRVTAVKGRCPGPLDDRVVKARAISNCYSWTQDKLPVESVFLLYLLLLLRREIGNQRCCTLGRTTMLI